MGALTLSKNFFNKKALPAIRAEFPGLKFAAGLAGNGSECFACDDDLSRDHDWGIDFFIWLSEDDAGLKHVLSELKYELLADEPLARNKTKYGASMGVKTVSEFYRSLTGCPGQPEILEDWLRAPESNFAMAVNGEVFTDDTGEFTKIRKALLNYYPENLRLKRLSCCAMYMAQYGQYNLQRMAARGDLVAVNECRSGFTNSAMHMVFLLNKKYMPYYKWRFRLLGELPVLGAETADLLRELAIATDTGKMTVVTEKICLMLENKLRQENLSDAEDSFMSLHGESIYKKITDPYLKKIPVTYEI